MAIPLIAGAIGALLRRYGMKTLEGKAKKELMRKSKAAALKKARKKGLNKASTADIAKGYKGRRGLKAAGNVAGDASTGALTYEAISNTDELADYIKENKPKLWAKFEKSGYDNIKEYLKAQA